MRISGQEWLLVLLVVLLIFGARKLPELARSLGSSAKEFRKGLEQIVVVEEKRGLIESQLKELLYGRCDATIVGKQDERGASLFPSYGALSSNRIAPKLRGMAMPRAKRMTPALAATRRGWKMGGLESQGKSIQCPRATGSGWLVKVTASRGSECQKIHAKRSRAR